MGRALVADLRYNKRMSYTEKESAIYDPREEVIEEFLEGQPRAGTWRELKEALHTRLVRAREEQEQTRANSPERAAIDERINELKVQIHALAEEEAITQFVEDSVRASLSRPRPLPDFGEEDDGGPY